MSGNVSPFSPAAGGKDPPRQMPHSIEAEQALLGACMINSDAIDRAERFVSADDFFDPLHARIWEGIIEAHGAGKHISPVMIGALFGAQSNAEVSPGVTARQYFARLAAEASTIFGAADFAQIIRNHADCRRVIIASEAAIEAAYQSVDAAKLASSTISVLDTIASAKLSAANEQTDITTIVTNAVRRAEDIAGGQVEPIEITVGLTDLDDAIGGLDRGDLTVLGGRPGMGKTTLALSLMLMRAKKGMPELFFSLEMNGGQLGQRSASCVAYMKRGDYAPIYEQIRRGKNLHTEDLAILREAEEHVNAWPLVIEQEGALTMSQVATRTRRVAEQFARKGKRLGVMTLDHMGIMKPSDRYKGNRVNEVAEFTGGLKALAKELEIHIVALCQLSRGVEGRDDKRPTLADFRDSGAIEQDADNVIAVYRDAYYLSKIANRSQEQNDELIACEYLMQCIVAKQRQGRTSTIDLFVSMGHNYVTNKVKTQGFR